MIAMGIADTPLSGENRIDINARRSGKHYQ